MKMCPWCGKKLRLKIKQLYCKCGYSIERGEMSDSPTAGLSPLMDMRIKLTHAEQEIERLTAELDNERARGIHSCGPHCQQIECKQGRRIAKLEAIESAAIKCVHEDDSYNNTNELAEALKEAK